MEVLNQPFSIGHPKGDEGKLYGGKLVPGGGTLKVQGSGGLDIPGLESVWVEVYDGKTTIR